jgi:hypothetical protein
MNDEFQKMRRALEQVPWNDGWLPCNMASAWKNKAPSYLVPL